MNKVFFEKECQTCDDQQLKDFDLKNDIDLSEAPNFYSKNDIKLVEEPSFAITILSTEQKDEKEFKTLRKFLIWSSLNSIIGFFTVYG